MTDNWAVDLWVRPDESGADYFAAATDNDAANGLTFWFKADNTIALLQGNNTGNESVPGPAYTSGTWYPLTAVVLDGTVYFYVRGSLQGSSALFSGHTCNKPMLGFGPQGANSMGAAFDQMRVWGLRNSAVLADVERVIFGPRGTVFFIQ
jgi:hypothetical protein